MKLRYSCVPSALLATVGGVLLQAAAVPGSWKVVQGITANQSPFPVGQDIAVVSANDIWQVGFATTGHWNGVSWTPVAPAGNYVALSGVAAVANNDVWAVGNAPSANSYNAVTEHWDGSAWSFVPVPNGSTNANGQTSSQLVSVTAISSNNVWAVGWTDTSVNTSSFQGTLIEHWDGSQWTVVPSPNPKGSSQNTLTGVAAINANDIWAVGYTLTTNNQTLTMHWNGSKWSIVRSPNGAYGNWLSGVTALATNNVWAVGKSNNGGNTLILHWDGSSWSAVPSPDAQCGYYSCTYNSLARISAVSATDIWAVGTGTYVYYSGEGYENYSYYPLFEHWDGNAWSIIQRADITGTNALGELDGVAAVSSGDVWAIGPNLTEHYTIP